MDQEAMRARYEGMNMPLEDYDKSGMTRNEIDDHILERTYLFNKLDKNRPAYQASADEDFLPQMPDEMRKKYSPY